MAAEDTPYQTRHSFSALQQTFIVDSEYEFVKELGQGAYGCVIAAKHKRSGEGCAIKKITNINTKVFVQLKFPIIFRPLTLFHSESSQRDVSARLGRHPLLIIFNPVNRPHNNTSDSSTIFEATRT
jgi:serine/threonine protein kinase